MPPAGSWRAQLIPDFVFLIPSLAGRGPLFLEEGVFVGAGVYHSRRNRQAQPEG